jgi:hypothetical protein
MPGRKTNTRKAAPPAGLRARAPILAAAALVAGLVCTPTASARPKPKSEQFPAACAQLWTGIVKVVKWNPRYKITHLDASKHLVVFSVGDAGKPSEGELRANPRRVGKNRCGLAVGFVTSSIGGTDILRAEAELFAQMVNMEMKSKAKLASIDGRLRLRRPAWRALAEVAAGYPAYKPVSTDEKRHSL